MCLGASAIPQNQSHMLDYFLNFSRPQPHAWLTCKPARAAAACLAGLQSFQSHCHVHGCFPVPPEPTPCAWLPFISFKAYVPCIYALQRILGHVYMPGWVSFLQDSGLQADSEHSQVPDCSPIHSKPPSKSVCTLSLEIRAHACLLFVPLQATVKYMAWLPSFHTAATGLNAFQSLPGHSPCSANLQYFQSHRLHSHRPG